MSEHPFLAVETAAANADRDPERRGLAAGVFGAVDRLKGVVAGASLSLATALSGAGATCATGRCGQGCGYACGIIGVTAAGGIVVTAIRRRLHGETDADSRADDAAVRISSAESR